MKHLIFTDIDGTIYPMSKVIHPQTKKDITLAQEKGIEVILCTGNAYMDQVEGVAEMFNIRYTVTSNGASIVDRDTKEFIFASKIVAEEANKMLQFANKNEIGADFWDEEKMHFSKFTNEDDIKIVSSCITPKRNFDIASEVKRDVFKIEFYSSKEKVDLMQEFLADFDYEIARMTDNHLEVTKKGISKGSALKWLVDYLGSTIDKTMAIGDSANDVSMFKAANHSYAMDNSSDEVKSIAHHHAADVEQNGLGMAIIDYMYREKLDK